ncbi:cupin domain-containing protein [soil metagenome]
MTNHRPSFIKHYTELEEPIEENHYPDSREVFTKDARLAAAFGLTRIGVHHETLPPGHRSCWPHAHEGDEELVFIIEGTPDVWIDGELFRLGPGDAVGYPQATGIAHVLINNTELPVRFIAVGDGGDRPDRVHYPRHPALNARRGPRHWPDDERPVRPDGGHDGMPDALRDRPVD